MPRTRAASLAAVVVVRVGAPLLSNSSHFDSHFDFDVQTKLTLPLRSGSTPPPSIQITRKKCSRYRWRPMLVQIAAGGRSKQALSLVA